MMEIRQASESDIEAFTTFEHFLQMPEARRKSIARSVHSGEVWVAVVDSQVVGYIVIEYTFFCNGFISMLYVHPDYRKKGIATVLIKQIQSLCTTDKLFTSTNESNCPMRSLMAKLQYEPSGTINNLDDGDAEIVYFKDIKGK